jgi:predicted O-methyltransferase YrrM
VHEVRLSFDTYKIATTTAKATTNMIVSLNLFAALLCATVGLEIVSEISDSGGSGPVHVPVFKADFFSQYIESWKRIFRDGGFDSNRPYHFLEIGSLEGRSAIWLLENVLLHPNSTLFCVDTWHGGDGYSDEVKEGLYERFMHNTSPYHHKMTIFRGKSFDALRDPILQMSTFDFVYIDGAHRARNTLEDAVLSFPLLKIGGLMVFDDYISNLEDPQSIESPKAGIDAFLQIYSKAYRIAGYGYQLNIMKIAE